MGGATEMITLINSKNHQNRKKPSLQQITMCCGLYSIKDIRAL